jgi:hypothetical protein
MGHANILLKEVIHSRASSIANLSSPLKFQGEIFVIINIITESGA